MAEETLTALRNQVIYSVYVRNHSGEGTFKAVQRDLDRIRSLGADILWLLPVHPIGAAKRKGTLGSPYAIQDYRRINPELGTEDDFRELVADIHRHGMKCIIDVVYNHTSPDSWLAENHQEWFYKTPEGGFGNRVGDWGDIVDLDYGQPELWDYQIETLKGWAAIVDGFRCDVAPLVPLEFWRRARTEVAKVNPDCFWLAESIEPAFILDLRRQGMVSHSDGELFQAFDACYDYDLYPYFCAYLEGQLALSAYLEKLGAQEYIYPDNYVKLRFLENHDRPRARALIPDERSLMNWTAFQYFQKGMPLIYGGQESGNVRCPGLFDKDTVDWDTGIDLSGLLKALHAVKQLEIMASGSCVLRAAEEQDTVLGMYAWGAQRLLGVFSLKGQPVDVETELPDGSYTNLIDRSTVTVAGGRLVCGGQPVIIHTTL
ncbi:alpha-amylase family glycosyl hydrolase [Paenibacillus tepidiphilus]|uniref:alpha-amylase family glycosyl hydrolase n=1 Tax=Paenibacillus tepidiphilus TaxID=2608683 RepID=UPI0012397616|nr:alpha-amylase family glycosyl hydrolase [Paenibacillus tepidiphilus]